MLQFHHHLAHKWQSVHPCERVKAANLLGASQHSRTVKRLHSHALYLVHIAVHLLLIQGGKHCKQEFNICTSQVHHLQVVLNQHGYYCGEDETVWWQFGMDTNSSLLTFQVGCQHLLLSPYQYIYHDTADIRTSWLDQKLLSGGAAAT